ncbi:MAG: Uma2 family endonuclease [Polyangiales bacterium]
MFLPEPELPSAPRPTSSCPTSRAGGARGCREDFFAADAPAAITLAPDWVCEVLSDATEAKDRGKKRRIYRRESVGHYWIVDPARRASVYRLEQGRWMNEVDTFDGDATVRAEPFDSIELDLSALWSM